MPPVNTSHYNAMKGMTVTTPSANTKGAPKQSRPLVQPVLDTCLTLQCDILQQDVTLCWILVSCNKMSHCAEYWYLGTRCHTVLNTGILEKHTGTYHGQWWSIFLERWCYQEAQQGKIEQQNSKLPNPLQGMAQVIFWKNYLWGALVIVMLRWQSEFCRKKKSWQAWTG